MFDKENDSFNSNVLQRPTIKSKRRNPSVKKLEHVFTIDDDIEVDASSLFELNEESVMKTKQAAVKEKRVEKLLPEKKPSANNNSDTPFTSRRRPTEANKTNPTENGHNFPQKIHPQEKQAEEVKKLKQKIKELQLRLKQAYRGNKKQSSIASSLSPPEDKTYCPHCASYVEIPKWARVLNIPINLEETLNQREAFRAQAKKKGRKKKEIEEVVKSILPIGEVVKKMRKINKQDLSMV